MLNKTERAEKIIKITIDLLKTQKVESINTYINFLSFIPDNEDKKQILTLALEQIVDSDLETIYWLLEHSHLLVSEGDIKGIVTTILKDKILLLGFNEQDFDFQKEGYLRVNPKIQNDMLKSYHLDEFFFPLILKILSQRILLLFSSFITNFLQ